jgi:polar amino acid transport system substrate-binding protein
MSKWLHHGFALVIALGMGCTSREPRPLLIGMELAYPPFEMTDPAGKPAGVSVDLAHALGKHLGRKVRIENTPFDGLIPALKTGRVDLVISSMTATQERSKSIDFSDPYVHTGLAILCGIDSGVKGIADLNHAGRTVVVKLGTTGHTYATQNVPNAKLLVLNKESACVLEVVQGKADAFLYDQLSTYMNWRRNRETTRAILDPFQQESWAVGIRKGNGAMRKDVNDFLRAFRSEGGFDRLGETHLGEMKHAFEELGYPFIF